MTTITCRTCGKRIRGNAGNEDYDVVKGTMKYTCRSCWNLFRKTAMAPIDAYQREVVVAEMQE